MAFIVSANLKIMGVSNPSKLLATLDVEVGFTEFEKNLFSHIGDATPFLLQAFIRSVDPGVPVPFDRAPLSSGLGSREVRYNGGNNFVTRYSREYTRGNDLNEDPFPFPNNADELNAIIYLDNVFSNTSIANFWSNTVTGIF